MSAEGESGWARKSGLSSWGVGGWILGEGCFLLGTGGERPISAPACKDSSLLICKDEDDRGLAGLQGSKGHPLVLGTNGPSVCPQGTGPYPHVYWEGPCYTRPSWEEGWAPGDLGLGQTTAAALLALVQPCGLSSSHGIAQHSGPRACFQGGHLERQLSLQDLRAIC